MKITKYDVTVSDATISCEDVPSRVCCNMACNECPFYGDEIELADVIAGYVEAHNADN